MKKNYTLKLVLAALVVVLVSLVSFVGVYKGRNLVKGYSLGKDFGQRKVATFSVIEDETSDGTMNQAETTTDSNETTDETESATEDTEQDQEAGENQPEEGTESTENGENTEKTVENQTTEPLTEDQKKENYNSAKNNIARRLTAMKAEEYDIRLDEVTGKLVIEVSGDMDSTYLSQIVTKGKVQIKNKDTNEIIVETNAFKDASARLDTTTYSKPVVVLNMKFTDEAKQKLNEANKMHTDSEGNETEATFEVDLENSALYSENATVFVESANSGELDLMMGQNDEGEDLEADYQTALAVTSIIKCGELLVNYEIQSIELISSDISLKAIAIIAIIISALMLIFALFKFKSKAVLPVLSLVGLVATILLVLRYANVKMTLFSILGIALVTMTNYVIILKTLNNKKLFKENFIRAINIIIPFIIVALVFCCAPYLQLASLGMTIFWGLIAMCIYNALIVRIFIEK